MAMTARTLEVRPGDVEHDLLDALSESFRQSRAPQVRPCLRGTNGEEIELPEELFELVVGVVEELKAGNGVAVVPLHARLTTVEAAEILNVSRPFLIKQLEAGVVPYTMVGTHRRLLLLDVLAHRDKLAREAEEALAAMTAEAEADGLYDN